MAREISPEEKLLNLIKKRKREDPPKPRQDAPHEAKSPAFQASDQLTARPGKKAAFFEAEGALSLERIGMFNAFLLMVLVIVGILFISRFFISPLETEKVLGKKAAEGAGEGDNGIESMPIDYYAKSISGKDIFMSRAADEPVKTSPEVNREELAVSLSLLGIVSGEEPQAIIEDTKQNKRMFIKKGQETGGIFLKDISDGSVTVVYKGEEINLSL